MIELFKTRLGKNLKLNVKYLSLVFNDFFVLAIIFLLGGFLFWYAQMLEQLPTGQWFYKPILAIMMFVPQLLGKFASLLSKADSQFIWTKDNEVGGYLKRAQIYSMLVPTIIILLVCGILFPFAIIKAEVSLLNFALIVLGLVLAKYNHFSLIINSFFSDDSPNGRLTIIEVVELFAIFSSLSVTGVFLLLEIFLAINLAVKSKKENTVKLFSWINAIDYEQKRVETVQGFYSLFTDIKDRPIKIKRRKYLDGLLPHSKKNTSPNSFLFERTLLRNPEFLNLIVRMTAFAILLALVVQDITWVVLLDYLIIFLTIYQLLPMYQQYDRNLLYMTLPLVAADKTKAFIKVLARALLVQSCLIAVIWLVFLPNKLMVIVGIGALFVLVLMLLYLYLPSKVKKIGKK